MKVVKARRKLGAVEKMMVVAIVSVLTLITWYAWSHRRAPEPPPVSQSATAAAAPAEPPTYLSLQSYRVRIPLVGDIKGLQLGDIRHAGLDGDDAVVSVRAPELVSGWKCRTSASKPAGVIGDIFLTHTQRPAANNASLATVSLGDYVYTFEPASVDCTDDADRHAQLLREFTAQFEKLESY